ncbi:MAG TPA: UDP-N-acetylglucosamine 2-epimerase (non-hydrolyzing) [Solirubrobacteraceae bacterium]|nr:UDP-N-acetylglucosamine 2-epimerase (non-hydrolyzing) [Solirubrobacteraceae bacterium]
MRILTVLGNRPQFIKAAVLSPLLRSRHQEVIVHTGQHHDRELSDVFFEELEIPHPDHQLGIAGGSNSSQLARMLEPLEALIGDLAPDALLVYGDTNSTLAGALAGAQAQVAVIHVEAGMRSGDMAMPEERNRLLTDHLAALLLCSSERSAQRLRAEGIGATRGSIAVVGDLMVDLALAAQARARREEEALARLALERGRYLLLTAHRAGNVDPPQRLAALVALIEQVAAALAPSPIVFPLHPRTAARLQAAGLRQRLEEIRSLRLLPPLPYVQTSALLCGARALLTDSGGMQKEAYVAAVPCLTLRPSTEWTETVQTGWNQLVDLDPVRALNALAQPLPAEHPPLYGAGGAAAACLEAIERFAAASAAEHPR